MEVINLADKLNQFTDAWSPRHAGDRDLGPGELIISPTAPELERICDKT